MSKSLLIRFDSPEGGVSLFLNGFLLFGSEDTGRAGSQAAPFLRPGQNTFELVSERANASASLSVVDLSDGDPQSAPVVLQMDFAMSVPGVPLADVLNTGSSSPEFGWHHAQIVSDIVDERRSLYQTLQTLASLLERGPDQDLLALLNMKHAEMSMSVELARPEMDAGLLDGLSQLREAPGFAVEIASPDDFLPLLSSDGRIVNMRRGSGGDAIKIIDGTANPGFSVAMANLENRWLIVR